MKRFAGWVAALFAPVAAVGIYVSMAQVGGNVGPPPISVLAYGAIPNDGIDDGPAVAAAITAARLSIANSTYATVKLVFPGGIFDFDRNNPLHPLIQEDGSLADSKNRPPYGIHFEGDSQNYTVLKLWRDAGNERWLYDSGSAATSVVPG